MVSAHTELKTLTLSIFFAAFTTPYGEAQIQKSAFIADKPPQTAVNKLPPDQMGDLYMARKMFREAIDAYREGAPDSALLWDKIGIAYHQLGDLNAARKSYERAIKLDSKYAEAINNVGTILYSQKRYRSAISRYNKALRISPDTASIWSNLGTAWYARGKYDEMTKAYAKAIELDPDVFNSHSAVGTTMLDRAVADKARYHYEMAKIYAQRGNKDLALQYLRKSLEEGFKDKEKISKAPEFADLRDTPEYKELLILEPRVL
jgi:tetratricopeptide (TPR) repeat protein